MAKTYRVLGLDELSADAVRVLKLNHPEHPGISEVQKLQLRD
jgi:outer membrane protein assembly factor BamD